MPERRRTESGIYLRVVQGIYEGDEYMDTPEGPVCKDCIEGMSVTEFCELIGESFKTAEKEEE